MKGEKQEKEKNQDKRGAKGRTRRFSNHVSRLLSRSHTYAIIVILDLKIHQSIWITDPFFQKLEPKVIDP